MEPEPMDQKNELILSCDQSEIHTFKIVSRPWKEFNIIKENDLINEVQQKNRI